MEAMKIRNLYNLEETIAAPLLEQYEYPWEVLPYIKEFIKALGNALPEDRFEKRGEDIWVAKSATVAPTACLNGPCIVDEEAEIRHCAFVRGSEMCIRDTFTTANQKIDELMQELQKKKLHIAIVLDEFGGTDVYKRQELIAVTMVLWMASRKQSVCWEN